MIKDILVCLEGSASSDRATDLAIEIARELSARLMGLAIVDEPQHSRRRGDRHRRRELQAASRRGAARRRSQEGGGLVAALRSALPRSRHPHARAGAARPASAEDPRGDAAPRHDDDRPRRELSLRDQGRGCRDARQHPAPRGQAGDRGSRGAAEDRPRRARLLRRKLGGQPRLARARRERPGERAQGPRRQRAGRRRGSVGDGEPRRGAAARPCRSPPSRAAWSRRCRSPRRSSTRAPSWARACWSSAPTPARG